MESQKKYDGLRDNYPALFSNYNAAIKIVTDPTLIAKWEKSRKRYLRANGKPEQWGDIGLVFEGPYFIIIRDLVEFPNGKMWSYSRLVNQADIEGGQGVVIMPEFQGKILLLYNFRHATRSWHYEFPRGFGEPGMTAEQQAHDEIKEETGGEINKLIDLGKYHNNTGMEGNQVQMFYAKLASIGTPNKGAGIESFHWVTVGELESMIRDDKITDGFTIAAYTRAKLSAEI